MKKGLWHLILGLLFFLLFIVAIVVFVYFTINKNLKFSLVSLAIVIYNGLWTSIKFIDYKCEKSEADIKHKAKGERHI